VVILWKSVPKFYRTSRAVSPVYTNNKEIERPGGTVRYRKILKSGAMRNSKLTALASYCQSHVVSPGGLSCLQIGSFVRHHTWFGQNEANSRPAEIDCSAGTTLEANCSDMAQSTTRSTAPKSPRGDILLGWLVD
jgi:hypothetical protein